MADDGTGVTEEPGDGRVVREVELPAAAEVVWQALTVPEEVDGWFGAPVRWELRPGGPVQVGVGDDGTPARRGEVDEVAPGRRLRFRWWPAEGGGPAEASEVTYDLQPVPDGTRLVVTEVPLRGPTASLCADRHRASGWDVRMVGLWVGIRSCVPVPVRT